MHLNKKILPHRFYLCDALSVSQALLGKKLVTHFGAITAGRIVETEAYCGVTDKGSHAYGGRHTARTQVMYAKGGVAYVYLCYGLHHLFNVVVADEGTPHAVLIRAIEPIEGLTTMMARRKMSTLNPRLSAGPGALTKALGITIKSNACCLMQGKIWLEQGEKVAKSDIIASPRVGIDYAQEDRDLPWRFRLKNSKWTSPAK